MKAHLEPCSKKMLDQLSFDFLKQISHFQKILYEFFSQLYSNLIQDVFKPSRIIHEI